MLNDSKIRQAKPAERQYKLTDSNGLYLLVKPNGTKLWRYKFAFAGKENTYSIGIYPEVTLSDARKARDEAKAMVKRGINPNLAKQQERVRQTSEHLNTFEVVANEWFTQKSKKISAGYVTQIESTLRLHITPALGKYPIATITSQQVLQLLNVLIKKDKLRMAILVRQIISMIFSHAIINLKAENDPTTALANLITIKSNDIEHAEPMSKQDIADLVNRLHTFKGMRTTAIALQMLLYTFVRTIELRRAEWADFRFDEALWIIPAEKMKRGRTHTVPLSNQVLSLLNELKTITGNGRYLFPNSRRPTDMMSATTVNRALEHIDMRYTGHDFRATASTYLNEFEFDDRYIEFQLAHLDKNSTRASYNHAHYLKQRTEMMQFWSDFIDETYAKYYPS